MIPPVGKSGPGTISNSSFVGHFGIVDQLDHRIANLGRVVRRDAGRHADGDPAGTVDQQVGKLARQDRRFGPHFVVGGDVVDRVELDVVQHRRGDRAQPSFGISHGRRRQPGDAAEVALLVDQQPTHVPFLGHPHQRRIDHAFAVRVIVTRGVTGDLCAFDPLAARAKIQVVHRDQDPSLARLQVRRARRAGHG